jgi:hypothetical protein
MLVKSMQGKLFLYNAYKETSGAVYFAELENTR